jgi:hypothetical protein
MEINELIKKYSEGQNGEGPILWHKKLHKNGSGEFACVKGIKENCESPVGCEDCYTNPGGEGFCLRNYGEPVNGFLVLEKKHQKLVDNNEPGAYGSIYSALEDLSTD